MKLRAFFADAHLGLPMLPADFWTGGRPFDADPTATDWTPIGPSILLPSVRQGAPAIVEWDWPVPLTANDHSCLLVLATCDQTPLDGGGVLIVDSLVPSNKQVTLRNLHVEDAVPGSPRPHRRPIAVGLFNDHREAALYDLVIDWSNLPQKSTVYLAFQISNPPILAATDNELARAGARVRPRAGELFPETYPSKCGPAVPIDFHHAIEFERSEGTDYSALPILLPGLRSSVLLLNPVLPQGVAAGSYRLDVQQWMGRRLVGGSTFVLRVAGKADKARRSSKEPGPG